MNRNVFLRCLEVANPRAEEMACGERLLAASSLSGIKFKGVCVCKGEVGGPLVIPSIQKADTGKLKVQGQSVIHNEFEANVGYI